MDQESPKEKLLQACGAAKAAPSRPGQDQEHKKYLEAVLDRAEVASTSAQRAQEESAQMCRQLNAFLRDQLPGEVLKAFEKVAKDGIAGTLRPLDESVENAAFHIKRCGEKLTEVSWNARIVFVAALMGIVTVLVGTCVVRYRFFGDSIDEAKRYELWGRKVEALIERCQPKEKEKFYRWVGGRP